MSTPAWFHRELYPGDSGPDVIAVQRLVGAPKTGVMDEDTLTRVRGVQAGVGASISGVVDHALAVVMGNVSTYGLVPEWFTDVEGFHLAVCSRLGCDFTHLEQAVRRFQSHHHITPTGVVDTVTAIALGD